MSHEDDRKARKLEKELDQHRALLSALVEKTGITAEDLMPYMNARHRFPSSEIGDRARKADAQAALDLVAPNRD